MPFTATLCSGCHEPVFILSGRFNGQAPEGISDQIVLSDVTDQTVTLEMDDSFSINRSGLAALTHVIQQMRGQNARVLLTNVSCNYSRLFKMVGLDKLADIRETRVEE